MHGVHFHLVDIPPNLRDELTAFVAETAAALKEAGLETSIAVPAKTANGQPGSAATAYDYAALGREVDFMVITAYDQHHQGSSPGPIAGADWVEEVVQYAVSQVSPEKLVLGIPRCTDTTGSHWQSKPSPRSGHGACGGRRIKSAGTASTRGTLLREQRRSGLV